MGVEVFNWQERGPGQNHKVAGQVSAWHEPGLLIPGCLPTPFALLLCIFLPRLLPQTPCPGSPLLSTCPLPPPIEILTCPIQPSPCQEGLPDSAGFVFHLTFSFIGCVSHAPDRDRAKWGLQGVKGVTARWDPGPRRVHLSWSPPDGTWCSGH